MPFNMPQTLNDNEVYSQTAYLLYLNGIIEEDAVMDASLLSDIPMRNVDRFIMAYPKYRDGLTKN